MPADQNVTITTVAAEAGVSIKTVSRVLNNEAHVRPDTRERVLEVVRALGYRPNAAARTLAGSRSYLLGLLYDNPAQSYVMEVQAGALRRCQERGYSLLPVHLPGGDWPGAGPFRQRVASGGVDGVIVSAPLSQRGDILVELERAGVPFVLLGDHSGELAFASVGIDDRAAAAALAGELLGAGHRRIGVIEGPANHAASADRLAGVRAALSAAGLDLPPERRAPGDFTYRSGLAAAEILLAHPEPPTAIMALNDDMAAGALATAHKLGIEVPRALSVTGFDDSPLATIMWPPLTTVRQPLDAMAAAAVDLLIGPGRDGGAGRGVLFDFEIVRRESVACVPE